MFDPKIHNKPRFKKLRKKLRYFGTETERVLWNQLKNNSLGLHFHRQFGIGNYIVDFCCWKEKLVIEIDGSIHNLKEVKENDKIRQNYLQSLGFTVLRFSNSQIKSNLNSVLEKIRLSATRSSPPRGRTTGGGPRLPEQEP